MRDLIFACCWIILFPAVFLSAHIGVLLWIWVALSTPNLLLYNFLSTFPFNKVIAIITFLVILVKPEKKDFYVDKIIVVYTIFAVIGIISNYMSINIYEFSENTFEKFIKEYALFVVITGVMISRHRLHATILTFCISLAMVGAFEAAAYIISGGGHKVLGSASLGDNNGVAIAVLMAVPLCYYLVSYSQVKLLRVAFSVMLFFNVLTIISTMSRGGFLGLIVLAIFLILNARRKLPILLTVGLAVAMIFIIAPEDWYGRISTIQDSTGDGSFMGRLVAWKVSTVAAMDRPFYGTGFHGILSTDVWNHYVTQIYKIGIVDTPASDIPPFALAAHSIYFEVLGDTGFTGEICFLTIILMCLFTCGSIARRCKTRPDLLWAHDLARLLRVTIIVYCAAGAAISFAYFEGFWIIVAVVTRLNRSTLQMVAEPYVQLPVKEAPRALASI